jgi:hypothetical protein
MPGSELPRRVELDGGRALVLRLGTPGDVDALAALYDGLSDDDVYLRFFTGHRPGPDLFERMVHLDRAGGALLVVDLDDPARPGPAAIVADAWYSMLPNGNGELAITVAEAWRGWLGAVLLDALIELAASRGVPNLEAEVMLRNRAMLALARRRGCVRLGDDGTAVRVELPTSGDVPSWPPRARHPRVLVEGRSSWPAQDAAMRAGLEVAVCAGPAARRHGCPLLAGGTCPLADGADVIVVSLATGDARGDDLLRRHREDRPEVPVIVEVGAATPARASERALRTTDEDATVVARLRAAAGEPGGR